MSYASEKKRGNPVSMALAIGVNGGVIIAVALSPIVVEHVKRTPMTGISVPVDPVDPPSKDQKATTEPKTIDDNVFVPRPETKTLPESDNGIRTGETPLDGFVFADGTGEGTQAAGDMVPEPPVAPFVAARRDARFAKDFQPDYPASLLQREIEGSASVRVLIGADGRVRDAQVISATHPDFGKATIRQALRSWRFLPAMRGDKAVEEWQTLTVRFTIN